MIECSKVDWRESLTWLMQVVGGSSSLISSFRDSILSVNILRVARLLSLAYLLFVATLYITIMKCILLAFRAQVHRRIGIFGCEFAIQWYVRVANCLLSRSNGRCIVCVWLNTELIYISTLNWYQTEDVDGLLVGGRLIILSGASKGVDGLLMGGRR